MHWSSIKAHHLSKHHGEFCKLFCCQTSRELEFFSVSSGTRSGEQLFNMIDNCTAFASGKDKSCAVFRELFKVDPGKLEHLVKGLDHVREAAVGRQFAKSKDPKSTDPKSKDTKSKDPELKDPESKDPKSKDLKDLGIRDIRNKLAHESLSADDHQFEILVSCARKLLEGICSVANCVIEEFDMHCVTETLAEIERIQQRKLHIVPLSDSERDTLLHWEQQLEQENESLKKKNEFLQEKAKGSYESRPLILKKKHRRAIGPFQSNWRKWITRRSVQNLLHWPALCGQNVSRERGRQSLAPGAHVAFIFNSRQYCSYRLHRL